MLSFVFCVQNPNNGVVGFGERERERERVCIVFCVMMI
jgi:hypothetical protein